tara:strand:- start:202 stop:432 length:231 start_codon:yes stop_codon:yes gene_type:complete
MKLQTKDEIIRKLIIDLEKDGEWIITAEDQKEYLINKGWIEALKWVLGLNDKKQEIFNEGKNTLVVKEKENNNECR